MLPHLIPRGEYRHLRVWAGVRLAAGIILLIEDALLLSIGRYGWAVLLFGAAVLHLWIGYQEMTITRPAPPRT